MRLIWFNLSVVSIAHQCFAAGAGKSPCHWDAFKKKTVCHSDESSVKSPAQQHLEQRWPEGNLISHLGEAASIVGNNSSYAPKRQEGFGAISKHLTASADQYYKKVSKVS